MNAPLTCHIQLPFGWTFDQANTASFDRILVLLSAHSLSDRIVSLVAACPGTLWVSSFLAAFAQFARLRVFHLICNNMGMGRMRPPSISTVQLPSMPRLSELLLNSSLAWDKDTTQWPAVTSLSAEFFDAEQILHALRSCPNLSDFHANLRLEASVSGQEGVWARIRARCGRLRRLTMPVPQSLGIEQVSALAQAHAEDIALTVSVHPAPAQSLFILGHLRGPLHMTFSTFFVNFIIEGRDAQRVRRL